MAVLDVQPGSSIDRSVRVDLVKVSFRLDYWRRLTADRNVSCTRLTA